MTLSIDDQLAAIKQLHDLDQARFAAQDELDSTPPRIAEESDAVSAAGREKVRLQAELSAAQASVRDGERDLAALERRRERAEARIPHLTSAEQIEATQREIGGLGEQYDELEMDVFERMEAADTLTSSLDAATLLCARVEPALAERMKVWTTRKAELDAEVARLTAAHETVTAPLPADLMRMYRSGIKASSGRRAPGGATTVTGATCDTCWAEFPRRWVNETIARKSIYACQTCKRVLLADAAPPDSE